MYEKCKTVAEKNFIWILIMGFGFIVTIFSIWRGVYVSDQRVRVDPIGEQLEQATRNQSDITDGVKRVEKRFGAVERRIETNEDRVDRATGRADALDEKIGDAAKIIADCERILKSIRERGQE